MAYAFSRASCLAATLLLPLLLTGCGAGSSEKNDGNLPSASAQASVNVTLLLLQGLSMRPSAALGSYVTSYMLRAKGVPFGSAMAGILAQSRIFVSVQEQRNDAFGIINDLGGSLQVDINELLARSANRAETFNTYTLELQNLLRVANEKRVELDEQLDAARDTTREARRKVSSTRSDLNRAIRDEDFQTAGTRQQQLNMLQAEQLQAEARQKELDGTLNVLEELIDIGTERWTAMTQNREVIIAGLEVITVPGVDDIGIIRDETRQERRDREAEEESIFGEM